MKTELENLIWIEKYRPQKFEDLILEDKPAILKFLKKPKSIPSFIFYSNKPGTGKTSTAKIIINELKCDALLINSSDERGIDTIREKIKLFARCLSIDPTLKRCIFLDEADGLTRQAQDSLRNLMEEYSENCFFIFSCNDLNKIIEPLRSRCTVINFERPNKADITARLLEIVDAEDLEVMDYDIEKIVNNYYPDIRSMISLLQVSKVTEQSVTYEEKEFEEFLDLIKKKEVKAIYEKVYSGEFKIMEFNKWYFRKLFEDYNKNDRLVLTKISTLLADTEKYWNLGANIEVVFIANILKIMEEV